MDPVPNSPPEIILSDRDDPDHSHSGPLSFSYLSPHHCHPISADRSASQEEINIHDLSDSRLGQLCPLEPHQASVDEEASLRASTVAETRIAHSDFLSSLVMGSLPPQIQAQENPLSLNLLPGVCPSLLNLQVFSPAARVQPELAPLLPELIMSPCFRQESCWMNISTVASTPSPRFGFSPCALVPCSPFTPDHSWFLLPEVQPVWCSCPQTAPVRPPCDPGLLWRKAGEPVSEQLNVTPKSAGKELSKETAMSEEKQQKNDTADKDKLQSNNTDNKITRSTASPGSLLSDDEESLAERAFEEYMAVMDSLCPKIHENMEVKETENKDEEDGEKEKLETENHEFLEYLDELCSDEDFVRKVESTLDIEFLESLLSSDLEMLDLLALEKQEQEVTMLEQSHQPSATSNSEPVTDGTLLPGSTLNIELLDSLVFSDQEFLDFMEELKQWVLEVTMQEQSYQPTTASISNPLTDEASQATSHVEGGAQTPILDPLGTSDPNPEHDGETPLLNTTNTGSKEGLMPTDGTPEYFSPVDALSSLGHNGSHFTDSSFTLSPYSSDILTFDLETTDHDALATLFLAGNDGPNVSEDASMSLSNVANTQSAQLSQKIQSGPLPGDPSASMSPPTSSVAGSTKDPALCFRADLLTDSPPQLPGPPALRVLAWKVLPSSQIKESEEQPNPRNLNPKSSCLKDMSHPPNDDLDSAIPVLSFVADSHPDSCDIQVDGDSSGTVPEEQISQELVSPGIFSELRTREWCDIEKKCDNLLEKGPTTSVTQKKTATKAREGMAKMTFERKEENKENDTKLVKLRCSQRLSDQNEKKKAGLSSELKTESAEERKPTEKSIKKTLKFTPEKDGVIYGKQTRQSSGGIQLCKREESNFEEWSQGTKITQTVEQFSEMGKNEHQKLTGEMQRLMVKVGEQCEPHDSDFCTKVGVENTFSTSTPREKSEKDERSVKIKQEGSQITCLVGRKTRSMTTEEKVKLPLLSVAGDGRKIQHSEIKDLPKREMQDKLEVNVEKYASESVSSPVKRSRSRRDEGSWQTANNTNKDLTACKATEDSANCTPISPPTSSSSSQRSTRVQTDTPPTKDEMIEPGKKSPEEAPLSERNEHKHPVSSLESPSVKICEKNPKLSPILDPESLQPNQQQSKKALSEGRAGGHSEVMEKPNVLKSTVNGMGIQKNKAAEKTHHDSPKPSPDQTADVKDDGERPNGDKMDHPSLSSSPMKRYYQECETSEETETRVNETDKVGIEPEILKSPMKRARWKNKAEDNSRRAEEQKQTRIEKGDEGSSNKDATFGICIPRTRSKTKAENKIISNPSSLTGQEMCEGEKTAGKMPPRDPSAMKTRTSLRRLPCFPSKKQRRLSKLPTKYEDFIFYKPKVKGQKRQLNREKGKAGKGKTQRSGKKRDD